VVTLAGVVMVVADKKKADQNGIRLSLISCVILIGLKVFGSMRQ